jgi:hypothetical protein
LKLLDAPQAKRRKGKGMTYKPSPEERERWQEEAKVIATYDRPEQRQILTHLRRDSGPDAKARANAIERALRTLNRRPKKSKKKA